MSQPSIYLASQSPRRRELLDQIGVSYQVVSVDVEEQRQAGESPGDYVCRLAREKAQAGLQMYADRPTLGADTIVVLGGQVFEKPRSEQEATDMLMALSGNTHEVMTAVNMSHSQQSETIVSVTSVTFRTISDAEARAYWLTGEPKDKAGGYGIQGLGSVFVSQIRGSYSCIVGLPLFETSALLARFGLDLLVTPQPAN